MVSLDEANVYLFRHKDKIERNVVVVAFLHSLKVSSLLRNFYSRLLSVELDNSLETWKRNGK